MASSARGTLILTLAVSEIVTVIVNVTLTARLSVSMTEQRPESGTGRISKANGNVTALLVPFCFQSQTVRHARALGMQIDLSPLRSSRLSVD